MNREHGWDLINEAARLGAAGNENAASFLLRQAGSMLDNYHLNLFAAEISRESCKLCGNYIDETDTREQAIEVQHVTGCPKIIEPPDGKVEHGDGQNGENYVRTFGPPGSAG